MIFNMKSSMNLSSRMLKFSRDKIFKNQILNKCANLSCLFIGIYKYVFPQKSEKKIHIKQKIIPMFLTFCNVNSLWKCYLMQFCQLQVM